MPVLFLAFEVFVYEFAVYEFHGDHGFAISGSPHVGVGADGFAVGVFAFLVVFFGFGRSQDLGDGVQGIFQVNLAEQRLQQFAFADLGLRGCRRFGSGCRRVITAGGAERCAQA